jgi:hypothetical protein
VNTAQVRRILFVFCSAVGSGLLDNMIEVMNETVQCPCQSITFPVLSETESVSVRSSFNNFLKSLRKLKEKRNCNIRDDYEFLMLLELRSYSFIFFFFLYVILSGQFFGKFALQKMLASKQEKGREENRLCMDMLCL